MPEKIKKRQSLNDLTEFDKRKIRATLSREHSRYEGRVLGDRQFVRRNGMMLDNNGKPYKTIHLEHGMPLLKDSINYEWRVLKITRRGTSWRVERKQIKDDI